jgi:glycosyltransferase involved in cell wall biosynthesis
MPGRVEDFSYLLIANGYLDGPPAGPFREWLVQRGAAVSVLVHPLSAEDGGEHLRLEYREGGLVTERRLHLPSRPPLTYPLDLLAPPLLPRADVTVAFSNLHAARAIVAWPRRTVVYWAVDFAPDRFGAGTPMTRAYEAVDRWVCRHADARFELSQVTLDARDAALALSDNGNAHVVPIGAWLDRVPQSREDSHEHRRIVFLGHLVPRMGVDTLIEALALLRDWGVAFTADIVGGGPLESELRAHAERLGLGDVVHLHGFIPDHRDLEALLAQGTLAVAPYATRLESFTRFADPGKLKSYLAAGLPIVLTDVPPNARELADQAGAELVADEPAALATAIERLLADQQTWGQRRQAALNYVRQFDWNIVLPNALSTGLGIG